MPIGKIVCYARVSSHDQAEQLKTPAARLEKHCIEADFADIEVVTDLGSGLNCRKRGYNGPYQTSCVDASRDSCS
jgi:putative resolvase